MSSPLIPLVLCLNCSFSMLRLGSEMSHFWSEYGLIFTYWMRL